MAESRRGEKEKKRAETQPQESTSIQQAWEEEKENRNVRKVSELANSLPDLQLLN